MDADLKKRIEEVIRRERRRSLEGYFYVQSKSVDEFMRVYREYHTRELNRLSVRGTIKILIRKIVNKFKNK